MACSSDKEAAKNLLQQAKQSIEQRNYYRAVLLLDSIDCAYKSQIEVRRVAMNVRPRAIEGMTMREIEKNDSLLATYQAEYVNLTPYFETINDSRLVEPYIVSKKAEKTLLDKTGIQARITTNGDFYVISSLVENPIKHTSVSFVVGQDIATTSDVAYDGDRNYRSKGSEMITFINSECDTLGTFACRYDNKVISLRFNGNKSKTIKMSAQETNIFATTYRYAMVVKNIKSTIRRKEFLEQQLMLARDQIARTLDESTIIKE